MHNNYTNWRIQTVIFHDTTMMSLSSNISYNFQISLITVTQAHQVKVQCCSKMDLNLSYLKPKQLPGKYSSHSDMFIQFFRMELILSWQKLKQFQLRFLFGLTEIVTAI